MGTELRGSLLTITEKLTSTNTAQSLVAGTYVVAGSSVTKYAQYALITVEADEIRVGFGMAPTQAGVGHKFKANDVIALVSHDMIKNFQYISADSGNHANLMITLEY